MPFAAPPPPPAYALVAQAPADDTQRPSLEELLRRSRAERDAQLAGLRPVVAEVMKRLEKVGPKGRKADRRELRETLAALDPACAELLVPWLEPGDATSTGSVFRAEETRLALEPIASLATVAPLVELAAGGTTKGRVNALGVLGHAPPSADVERALALALEDSAPTIRLAAVRALGFRSGDTCEALLAKALADPASEVAAAALVALAEVPGPAAGPAVLAFAVDRDRSAAQLPALVAYYSTRVDAVGDPELDALLPLLYDVRSLSSDKLALLGLLADVKLMTRSDRRKALDTAAGAANGNLREAARICQALLGDRAARKDLLQPYDDAVSERPRHFKVYVDRGNLNMRLREYDRAAKDFKKALDQEIEDAEVERKLGVALARAYALDGKLAKASSTLEDAWLSRRELRALARDPDFAELAEHSRHGKILRPD